MAVVTIRPTSTYIPNPDYQHWANASAPNGSTGANSWTTVDEAVSDEDTSWVQCATVNHSYEHFVVGATGVTSYPITNVRFNFRCSQGSTNATGYCRAIVGGVGGQVGDTKTVTTSYVTYTQDWATNPITGVAWVWADFVNYKFGVEGWGSGTKSTCRITQFYVEITYQVPTTVVQGLVVQGLVIQ